MYKLDILDVTQYVEKNIQDFHEKRLANVKSIKLSEVLRTKNPYLFKAKNVNTASEIIERIMCAFLCSNQEGIFGNWLDRLAVNVAKAVYGGQKAVVDGIDLDFVKNGKRYLVAIISGQNWGNDRHYKKLVDEFNTAKKRSATSSGSEEVIFVTGCCYGRSNPSSEYQSKDYHKMCGQRFWELISGEPDLYINIIEPLGHKADRYNLEFLKSYAMVKNRLEKEFLIDYTHEGGSIIWDKLLKFHSNTEQHL